MRYSTLDTIRGFAVLSMVLYHILWDLVYLFFYNKLAWFQSTGGYLWQQSICWTFILLSGFCWSLGNKKLQRGLAIFLAGAAITAVTLIFLPAQKIVFGILTLIGSCMLILIPLEKLLKKIPSNVGLLCSAFIFILLRNVARGSLGFEGMRLGNLPACLYKNIITAYFGFPGETFYSADYFPLLPWFFLFLTGYFLYRLAKEKNILKYLSHRIPAIAFIGRHSLPIYIVHQPIVYLCIFVLRQL